MIRQRIVWHDGQSLRMDYDMTPDGVQIDLNAIWERLARRAEVHESTRAAFMEMACSDDGEPLPGRRWTTVATIGEWVDE